MTDQAGQTTITFAEPEAVEELRFWSVTTLMGECFGKSEGIIQWSMARVAERAYDRIATLQSFIDSDDRDGAVKWLKDARWEKLKGAGERGTSVHGLIEAYALGREPEVPDDMLPYDEQVRRFLREHRPVFEMAEAPVYHPGLLYAGTLDLILRFPLAGNLRCIVDAKTTYKAPPEIDPSVKSRPPYPEIALQLCAYSRATHVGVSPAVQRTYYGRRYYIYDPGLAYMPMQKVDGALALIVSPYDYQLVPVRVDEEVWRTFTYVREVARWQLEISKRVLGQPLAPPPAEPEAT